MKKRRLFGIPVLVAALSGCTEQPDPAGTEITWRTDQTIEAQWETEQELAGIAPLDLRIKASEAEPVRLLAEGHEDRADGEGSGGIEADYAYVSLKEEDRQKYPGLQKILEEYAGYLDERKKQELDDNAARQKFYHAKDPDSYIYLTTWLSMQAGRTDSQMVSYFTEAYRYNRNYEPDYYEVHGITADPVSGERYSLNDFFTGTGTLPETIVDAAVTSGKNRTVQADREKYVSLIRESIEGCRDDGSFAWCVYPDGIAFRFVYEYMSEKKPEHAVQTVFLPFDRYRDILRKDVTDVSYDYIVSLASEYLGIDEIPEGQKYASWYRVQKNKTAYLYASRDEETVSYRIVNGKAEETGRITGEIAWVNVHDTYLPMDTEEIPLIARISFLQEIDIANTCQVQDDGIPAVDGMYRVVSNSMPIMIGIDAEAEIFDDEESTESHAGSLRTGEFLRPVRTDAATFIDAQTEEDTLCRLYIEGSEEEGWIINGLPQHEIISHMGWFEE